MDNHTWAGTPTETETALMQERMKLFIFPNQPETTEEATAFDRAVLYQIAHEKSLSESESRIPDGVKSFSIGDFSMTFGEETASALTMRTICPAAYSVLLRAGLLYRGLPRTVSE